VTSHAAAPDCLTAGASSVKELAKRALIIRSSLHIWASPWSASPKGRVLGEQRVGAFLLEGIFTLEEALGLEQTVKIGDPRWPFGLVPHQGASLVGKC
jgi:hypothetical protein